MPQNTSDEIAAKVRSIAATAKTASHGRPLTSSVLSPFRFRDRFALSILHARTGALIAYVVIPPCNTADAAYGDPRLRHTWAEDLFGLIEDGKAQGAQGWILDLRGNDGGYTAPMLAGVQALLGEGYVLGYRGPAEGYRLAIRNGQILVLTGSHGQYREDGIDEAVTYAARNAPVAILTDTATGGAAEDVAVAFKGRLHTRFFGQKTAGTRSHGKFFKLSDGAVLFVSATLTSDRNGKPYAEGVLPDIAVSEPLAIPPLSQDAAVLAAAAWLQAGESPAMR